MLSNYYTLRYVATTLHSRLAGKAVTGCSTQDPNEIVIEFDHDEKLVVTCRVETNTLFLHPGFTRARKNSTDVLPGVTGEVPLSVHIHPGDRAISIKCRSGRSVLLQLYGGKANVLFLDESGVVRAAFKRSRKLVGESILPPEGDEPRLTKRELLNLIPTHGTFTLREFLKQAFPTLGSTLIQEITFRSGLEESVQCGLLPDNALEELGKSLEEVASQLDAPLPLLYLDEHDIPSILSIIPLRHRAALQTRPCEDIHEAIRLFIYRQRRADIFDKKKQSLAALLRLRQDKTRRTISAIRRDCGKETRSAQYELFGNLLLSHAHRIQKGISEVSLSDGTTTHNILLQPRLSPIENAGRYFEKARSSRNAMQFATTRLEQLERHAQHCHQLLAHLDDIRASEALERFMDDHKDDLRAYGIGEKGDPEEQLPFRTFVVDGGFEVWAGKSSTNNDLLTMKFARPNDLWFHARGSSGSHVILRVGTGKGEPGKKAREQAAAIAAFYSKMKNSKLVPVAVTERKYVRKPKGSPPGTVALEREKVMFVAPSLPAASREE